MIFKTVVFVSLAVLAFTISLAMEYSDISDNEAIAATQTVEYMHIVFGEDLHPDTLNVSNLCWTVI